MENNKLEQRLNRLENKINVIFDTLEDIKIDLIDKKNNEKIHEAKRQKEDAELRLRDIEIYSATRWRKRDEDWKRFNGYGERVCELKEE
jgi:hypothetical protein